MTTHDKLVQVIAETIYEKFTDSYESWEPTTETIPRKIKVIRPVPWKEMEEDRPERAAELRQLAERVIHNMASTLIEIEAAQNPYVETQSQET